MLTLSVLALMARDHCYNSPFVFLPGVHGTVQSLAVNSDSGQQNMGILDMADKEKTQYCSSSRRLQTITMNLKKITNIAVKAWLFRNPGTLDTWFAASKQKTAFSPFFLEVFCGPEQGGCVLCRTTNAHHLPRTAGDLESLWLDKESRQQSRTLQNACEGLPSDPWQQSFQETHEK